jgi:hypothetical protein
MVNWGALIEAPIGVMLLYVGLIMVDAIQDPIFAVLGNTEAVFAYGATIKILIQLVALVLGVMLLYSTYRSFREPESPGYVLQS